MTDGSVRDSEFESQGACEAMEGMSESWTEPWPVCQEGMPLAMAPLCRCNHGKDDMVITASKGCPRHICQHTP